LKTVTILSSPVETTASGIGTQKWLGVVVMKQKMPHTTTTAMKSRDLFRHEELEKERKQIGK
jgi:hypothetical protein